MYKVHSPEAMNQMFTRAFNAKSIDSLLELYADDAVLVLNPAEPPVSGKFRIRNALEILLKSPGVMTSQDTLCMAHRDLAFLRADINLRVGLQVVAADQMSALIHKNSDGLWLYSGATLPRI